MTITLPVVKRTAFADFPRGSPNFIMRQVSANRVRPNPYQGSDIRFEGTLPPIVKRMENAYYVRPRPQKGPVHKPTPFQTERFVPVVGPDPLLTLIGTASGSGTFGSLTADYLEMHSQSIGSVFHYTSQGGFQPYVENRAIWDLTHLKTQQYVFGETEPIFESEASNRLYYDLLLQGYVDPPTGGFVASAIDEPSSSMISYVDIMARSKVAEKLSQGDINLGVFFAELPETWEWLATMGFRLVRFVSALLRLDFKGALKALRIKYSRKHKRVVRSLASADDFVLEYSYAFRPLLADLYGFVEAVLSGLRDQGQLIHVHASAFSSDSMRAHVGERIRGFGTISPGTYDPSDGTQCGVSYDLSFRVRDPTLRTLQELGLVDPFVVVWEKVPFSFLVDWLLNFNSIVQSTTAGVGLEFNDGSFTVTKLSPISYSPNDRLDIEEGYRAWFSSRLSPSVSNWEVSTEVQLPVGPIGALFSAERTPLQAYNPQIDLASIRWKLNPFSSSSRVMNFLALLSKALQK